MSKFRPRNPQICQNIHKSSQVLLKMRQTDIRLIGQKAADHGGIIESFL